MKRQPRRVTIGSQYYINPDSTVDEIRHELGLMAEHGLRLVRIFAIWDHLEPRQGVYNWLLYDALFDAAAEHGMGVIPTLFAVSPPGWMGMSDDSQAIGPLEDERYWGLAAEHVQKVVSHWRDHPALHSWILWNEPSRVPPADPGTDRRWREWLQRRYGQVAQLNAHRYRQVSDWEGVPRLSGAGRGGSAFRGFEADLDRLAFAVDELQHWLADLAQWVRKLDDQHPIHVNPHNVAQSVLAAGQSLWREGDLVDFIGVSAHPPWHSTRFPAWRVPHSLELFADLGRSASRDPDGRFWVSELQGGPTVFSAEHASGPSPADMRRWLAHALASGAEGVLFWCFNQRSAGYEVGEWGLLGLDKAPTNRLRAVHETAAMVDRHRQLFDAAQPWPAQIAILHSEDSERLAAIAGRGDHPSQPRNRNGHWDALVGAWLLLRDLGYEVLFIDEDRWRSGETLPASVSTVVVPAAHALHPDTARHLQRFAETGGQVLADGLVGWNDGYGRLTDGSALSELFGARLHDLRGLRDGSSAPLAALGQGSARLHGWLFAGHLNPLPGTQVLARWSGAGAEDEPAITRRQHGHGAATRLATLAFAQYLAADDDQVAAKDLRATVAELLPAPSALPLRLSGPAPRVWLRRLAIPGGSLNLVINHGPAQTLTLAVPVSSTVRELDGVLMLSDDGKIAVDLESGGHRWLQVMEGA